MAVRLGPWALVTILAACGGGGSASGDTGQSDVGSDAAVTELNPAPQDGTPRTAKAITTDFPNPERGMTGWAGDLADSFLDLLQAEVAAGYPLLRSQTLLGQYRTTDLPADYLARLEAGFANLRNAGAKVILRFAYVSPPIGFVGEAPDAPLAQVLRHIDQLGPVLARHQDVIAWFEAGFIGAWGEWHGSTNDLDSPASKLAIRDALLAAFPAQRPILFRDPADMARWYPSPAQVPMRANGDRRAGIHNDCFLSTPTDGDTFPDSLPGLRDYTAQLNLLAPYGGETCSIPNTLTRESCADILTEGPRYSLSYLNSEGAGSGQYQRGWAAQGCLAQVSRSIGYRFVVDSVTLPATAKAGQPLAISLGVSNVGWAKLSLSRPLVVTLTRQSDQVSVSLPVAGSDAAGWLPGSTPVPVDAVVTVPADLAPQTYTVSIGLPDPSPALATDVRYAIRFANANEPALGLGWDAPRGRYIIGAIVIEAP